MAAITRTWEAAIRSAWQGADVWVHGDIAAANLLVNDGRLAAVIDFGSSGVGDPACDLTIAWTFLGDEGTEAFADAMKMDGATWARARGWALWKALVQIVDPEGSPRSVREASRVLERVLGDERNPATN